MTGIAILRYKRVQYYELGRIIALQDLLNVNEGLKLLVAINNLIHDIKYLHHHSQYNYDQVISLCVSLYYLKFVVQWTSLTYILHIWPIRTGLLELKVRVYMIILKVCLAPSLIVFNCYKPYYNAVCNIQHIILFLLYHFIKSNRTYSLKIINFL